MNNCTLNGEEYSDTIPLLLNKFNSGRIHSRFSNGFNIQMGDSLVFIGNKKNGLLPFGVHLVEEETFRAVSSVSTGESVTWNPETTSMVFPRITIRLKKGQSFKNELTSLTDIKNFDLGFKRLCLRFLEIEQRSGLEVSIREFLDKYQNSREKNWIEVECYLKMLCEVTTITDEVRTEKVLRYFLGRGQGLTPSGDDMLVGLLAFDAVSQFLPMSFYRKLSDLIETESITTDVAREYLRYALKQQYSSTVSNMVNTIAIGNTTRFEEDFQSLLGVGHSSGLDTLLGILIGMLSYKNIKNTTENN